ncbi:MAG: leucine-rich repeat protein [Clostridia bacterium]|nr:leucine-rich repeat protein [Clostridia bacterium]
MKKVLSAILTFAMLVSIIPTGLFSITASALTDGYYTYTVSNGEATITDYNSTYSSGDITIPYYLGGYKVVAIGDSAFSFCSKLTSVTIPNGVRTIGSYAFSRCSSITKIKFSDLAESNLTSIGSYAFSGCTGLTGFTMPTAVTSIGSGAFEDCTSIKSIFIQPNVTSLPASAFDGCTSLISITVASNNANYSSVDGVVYNKNGTTLLIYPKGRAGDYYVPQGVTRISGAAFDDCQALTSVTIPSSVTVIEQASFEKSSNLLAIQVDEENPNYSSDDFGVLYDKNKTTLLSAPGAITRYTIPEGVLSVGYSAFSWCSNLARVIFSQSVTGIERYAFFGCEKLDNVNIPNSVTKVGYGAFYQCSGLTNIVLPDSITKIDENTFYLCENLTDITIPGSVTTIGNYAFYDCISLTKVILPNGVTSIGDSAFLLCSALTEITIPKTLTSIGKRAFYGCDALNKVWYLGSSTDKAFIALSEENDNILNATWHYNSCPVGAEHVYSNSCDATCNKCGNIRTITHKYQWVVQLPATCKETGIKYQECSVCYKKQNENTVIPATGNHSFEWVTDQENTCGKDGKKHEECSVCHDIRNENTVIPATGNHVYTNVCDSVCNVCEYVRTAPHNYEWVIDKQNTCGVDGIKHQECTLCHDIINAKTVIPATGNHSFKWVTEQENTCGKDGKKHEECSVCHKTRNENTVIPATGNHVYTNVCDTICDVCEYVRTAPHNYEWIIDKQNTCGEDGVKHQECTLCHIKKNINTIIYATGQHTFGNENDTECDICGQAFILVQFNSNGGTAVSSIKVIPNQSITLPSITPIKSGYNFAGWAISKNGEVVYKPGGLLCLNNNIVLYAQWNKRCTTCGGDNKINCSTCYATGKVSYTCGSCKGQGGSNVLVSTCSNCSGYGFICEYCGYGAPPLAACPRCKNNRTSVYDCSRCVGGGIKEWRNCTACAGKGTYSVTCGSCNGAKTKHCTACDLNGEVIRNSVSSPGAPTLQSVNENTVILNSITNGEYSLDGITWQDSPIFDNLETGKEYNFYQRYAKTDTTNASEPSEALKVVAHNHTYSNACDAECNVEGCEYTRIVEPHNYEWVIDTENNCGVDGKKHEECTVCDAVRNENTVIPATGEHTYDHACDAECNVCKQIRNVPDHVYTNACDTICNVEGCGNVREITHDYEWVIDEENTCGKDGKKHEECTVCNAVRNENTIIPATGEHTYDHACDAECNVCKQIRNVPDHVYTNDCDTICNVEGCGNVREITHNYEWVIDEENTCGVDGYKHEECTVCDAVRNENTVIPATGEHTYDHACDAECNVCKQIRNVPDHIYTNSCDTTCNVEGCGFVREITHDYEWVTDKDNNCGVDGKKHEECSVCGETRNENTVIPATNEHSYSHACDAECNVCKQIRNVPDHVYTNACDTICNVEGCGNVREIIHDYEWVIDEENTCGKDGKKHQECTVCNAVQNENTVIPATGEHSYDSDIDPDCNVCEDVREITYTGWYLDGANWLYYAGGEKATGWQFIGNFWYYFNTDGIMQTGWLNLGGTWYFLAEGGNMVTGWQHIGNFWYYFHDGGNMATGWLNLGGTWYFLADGGNMVTGWQRIGNFWYYFHDGGNMATGWLNLGGTWYYMAEGGNMVTGWLLLGGTWYYFADGGNMLTGWQYLGGNWYLFADSGAWIS